MRRVVFNRKGGVGKSSIACNLAAISAAAGLRTLVVDLDPQANSTQYLLGREPDGPTLRDFFDQTLSFGLFDREPGAYVHRSPWPNLDVLPAHPGMVDLQPRLESRYKIYKLREALPALGRYQAIYLDTPPAVNFFSLSALIAADRCLVPFDCDAFSRRALTDLIDRVREIVADHNPQLEIEGVVVNQFQPRATLPNRMVGELRAAGLRVLEPFLGHSVKMRESHEASRPLVWFAPRHKLTAEYRALFAAIEDRCPAPAPADVPPRPAARLRPAPMAHV